MGVSIWQVIIIVFLLWPAIHILISPRSVGGEKFGWFLLAIFFSWLAYPVFLIVTQKSAAKKDSTSTQIDT